MTSHSEIKDLIRGFTALQPLIRSIELIRGFNETHPHLVGKFLPEGTSFETFIDGSYEYLNEWAENFKFQLRMKELIEKYTKDELAKESETNPELKWFLQYS